MTNYQDHLDPNDARHLCDVRVSAIAREAYSNHLTGQAFLAMGQDDDAKQYLDKVDSLNIALGVVLAERTRWEEPDGDDR